MEQEIQPQSQQPTIPQGNRNKIIFFSVLGVFLIAVVFGIGVYLFMTPDSQKNNEQKNIHVSDKLAPSRGGEDVVLVNGKRGAYEVNISTKESRSFISPADSIANFSGLPKEIKNEKISVSLTSTLLSQDKTRAIVIFSTFDETLEPDDYFLPSAVSADEFMCDIAKQECSLTDSYALAYEAVYKARYDGAVGDDKAFKYNWFESKLSFWSGWDSAKNLLYGYSNRGVFIFDLNNKSLRQTSSYSLKEKRAYVTSGAFSPSLDKFVILDKIGDTSDLLLYESNDLSSPLRTYDIPSRVRSVAWSADEKSLVLEIERQISILDLESGKISIKYTDTREVQGGLSLNFNSGADFSPSGRYIVFVDDDSPRAPEEGNYVQNVLKAIDLEDNNKVIELLREEKLSLHYRF